MNISPRDNAILTWQDLKAKLDTLKVAEMEARKAAIALAFPEGISVGVNNLELGRGYVFKATGKLNYTLTNGEGETEAVADQIEALGNEGKFLVDRLIKWKPELSISEYKKLEVTGDNPNPTHVKIKALIDSVLTIKEGSPELEVKVPK